LSFVHFSSRFAVVRFSVTIRPTTPSKAKRKRKRQAPNGLRDIKRKQPPILAVVFLRAKTRFFDKNPRISRFQTGNHGGFGIFGFQLAFCIWQKIKRQTGKKVILA